MGAGAVLDFEHNGVSPYVSNITDEVLKLTFRKLKVVKDSFCVSYMTMLLEN